MCDWFELVRSNKPLPQLPGSSSGYAKEHRDWIRKLIEELISAKSEIVTLKNNLKERENKMAEFEKDHETRERAIKDLMKRVEELESASTIQSSKVDKIDSDLRSLGPSTSQLDDIKKVVEETAKKVTLAEVVKRGLDHNNDDFEVNLALANNKERREKEKRARNLIIFGLNRVESQKDDEKQAYELIDTLKVARDQVERVTRLNSKSSSNSDSRPAPFLIEFVTSSARDGALKSTRNLKGIDKYIEVRVAPDLTPNERAGIKREQAICADLNKDLPVDSPYTWRVRSGERSRIDKNTKRIYKPPKATGSSV